MSLEALIAVPGLWLLATRWHPRKARAATLPAKAAAWPKVSIIVPARNEAANLPRLLHSLTRLDYPDYEIIVLDDGSEDDTAKVAASFGGVTLVRGAERPEGWKGKQWACHLGQLAATGEILLFTDADTAHEPDSLRRCVAHLHESNATMLSCLPYHDGRAWWELFSGPFHVLLLTVTAPLGVPRPGRVYAIGQYLMFTRSGYDGLGGHTTVRADLVEDLPLANHCLASGGRYTVFAGRGPVFRVRMYANLGDFIAGWRRNFRAGLTGSSAWAPVEMAAVIASLTGAGHLGSWLGISAALVAMALVAMAQRRLGRFSPVGVLLFPWSVGLLCAVTMLAVLDMVLGRPMIWKGRNYVVSGNAR